MKRLHRPTLIALGLTVMTLLFLAGCNTARGFGQDVQNAGEHIEHAAH